MSSKPESRENVEDQFIESLLTEAYASRFESKESQIQSLLDKIDQMPVIVATETKPARYFYLRREWIGIALAASVVFLIFVARPTSSVNVAYAAIERSLAPSPRNREYRISKRSLDAASIRSLEARLFIGSQNEFAVELPSVLPKRHGWFGGNEKIRWFAPTVGPGVRGSTDKIGPWIDKTSPDFTRLSLQTALERMRKSYDLKLLPNEWIASDPSDGIDRYDCQHVIGIRSTDNPLYPKTVELFARSDSGVAQRLILYWSNVGEASEREWIFDLVGSPNLPGDWFTLEGHLAAGRKVIDVSSPSDLETLSIEN